MRILSAFALVGMLSIAAASASAEDASYIIVSRPWAHATPAGAQTGAVYMTLTNKSSETDRLIGGASPVSDEVQIHEMKVENGIMQMRELPDGLAIPAKGHVTLKPGSYHVMLIGLKQSLKKGDRIALTLSFAKAGKLDVNVPVLAIGAMAPGPNGSHGMDMK